MTFKGPPRKAEQNRKHFSGSDLKEGRQRPGSRTPGFHRAAAAGASCKMNLQNPFALDKELGLGFRV